MQRPDWVTNRHRCVITSEESEGWCWKIWQATQHEGDAENQDHYQPQMGNFAQHSDKPTWRGVVRGAPASQLGGHWPERLCSEAHWYPASDTFSSAVPDP
jgi:hypothetical protein